MIDLLPWQVEPLKALLARRQQLPHALLIHGRAGIGKVAFARALANSLLCEAPQDGLACGVCSACHWFSEGNHPDFRELQPEASVEERTTDESEPVEVDAKDKKKSREIKIEQVRGIADFMTLSTHRDGFRVLLIHPADALNLASANALLKTLEEPLPRSAIILVSDQLGRLLATIRSRCQKVLLTAPSDELGTSWLAQQGVSTPALALAAAGGAPLDALAFSAPEYRDQREAFVRVLASSPLDFSAAGQAFEKAELGNLLHWLQTWVSDILLFQANGAVRFFPQSAREIGGIANRAQAARVFRYESELRQSKRLVHHPLNARLFIEQLLISYAQSVRAK